MALMLAQTMAAEAGTDNDGVEWKVVDGTSLVRVMLVSVRKATRRSHKCEKILEVSLWGPANRLRTSLNCSAIAASSRTNSAIVELHGIASLLRDSNCSVWVTEPEKHGRAVLVGSAGSAGLTLGLLDDTHTHNHSVLTSQASTHLLPWRKWHFLPSSVSR